MNRTRMVASSISTILRRTVPSTSRCISFVTSHSQTLSQRQPTVPYSLEHSSSVLPISGKNFPLKIQLFGGGFCSKSGDRTSYRCWNCDASLEKMPFVFCDSCGCIQPLDEIVDYFQFFGLERKYEIDFSSLEEKYKDWINRLHTVQGQTKSEKECNYAARLLGKAYLAYRFLKRPWRRVEHIMQLNGIDVEVKDYRYGLRFTKEIREIREAVKEANDSKALDKIQYQLISSTITGIINFWLSTFPLPKAILKQIESLCSSFLWSGVPNHTKKAKVAWNQVTMSKAVGGLGLRDIRKTSSIFCLKLLWSLFHRAGSLWVAWVHRYLLKGRSLWSLHIPASSSWSWRHLLKCRDFGHPWFDSLPSTSGGFSFRGAWNSLFPAQPPWEFSAFVWFSDNVPRHSFIGWLLLRRRLPTRDRLISWGISSPAVCVLCNLEEESMDHTFFGCSFSYTVWVDIVRCCGLSYRGEACNFLRVLKSLKLNRFHRKICCWAWNAAVYEIWCERNRRIFNNSFAATDSISQRICQLIKLKIMSYFNSKWSHSAEFFFPVWNS